MQQTIIFYKTDASFDYGDFDYNAEHEHGIRINFNASGVPDIKSLEGLGNFIYLTPRYTLKTLYNELKTHLRDITQYNDAPVTFINKNAIAKFLRILKKEDK